jgi:hypothetical protein
MATASTIDDKKVADAINCLSSFLSTEEVVTSQDVTRFLEALPETDDDRHGIPVDVIVLCGSAILSIAEDVFSLIASNDIDNASGTERISL